MADEIAKDTDLFDEFMMASHGKKLKNSSYSPRKPDKDTYKDTYGVKKKESDKKNREKEIKSIFCFEKKTRKII